MILIHGENIGSSRRRLAEIIDQARTKKISVVRLEAKKMNLADLEQALSGQELFEFRKVVIIEGLHSLPTSTKKKNLVSLITSFVSENDSNQALTKLVLWEKRALTKTMVGKFPGAKVEEFKIKKAMFAWLESLVGRASNQQQASSLSLFHQAIDQENVHFAMVMLNRQVRLLIQIKDGGEVKGPPFMIAKLKKQAGTFTLEQLLSTHQRLLEIDRAHKTSTSFVSLQQDLDHLLLSM